MDNLTVFPTQILVAWDKHHGCFRILVGGAGEALEVAGRNSARVGVYRLEKVQIAEHVSLRDA